MVLYNSDLTDNISGGFSCIISTMVMIEISEYDQKMPQSQTNPWHSEEEILLHRAYSMKHHRKET